MRYSTMAFGFNSPTPSSASSARSGLARWIPTRRGGKWHPRRAGQLLVAACLLLPIALFAMKALNDRAMVVAKAESDIENATSIFAQHAHNNFDIYQLAANVVNEHVRDLSWQEITTSDRVHTMLEDVARDYPEIRSLFLIDRDGTTRETSLPADIKLPNFAVRPYFTALQATDKGKRIGPHVPSLLDPSYDLILIAQPRTVTGGSFDGVISVSASPSSFEQVWQAASPGGITAMFYEDGTMLSRFPHLPGDIPQFRASAELIDAFRAHNHGIRHGTSRIEHEPTIMAFRKLDGYPIFITHALTTHAILRHWYLTLLRDSGVFAIADVCLVLLAVRVNRRARREEVALANRTDELARESLQRIIAEAELEHVLRSTLEQQEADRSRIARDLHDGLGQNVTTLHFGLDDIWRDADNAHAVRTKAQRLQAVAKEVSHEIGRIAWELRPVALDDLGLQTALQSLVDTVSVHSGLQFDLHIMLGDRRLGSAKETALYRVVQEGLANIVKHAGATRVGISLTVIANEVRLIIEDDGNGFDWDESAAPSPYGGGSGLLGMRERMSLVGGTLEVEAAAGQGAALFIRVPI